MSVSHAAFTVASFTAGKNTDRNEDAFGHNATTIVLSDGATDKVGTPYEQDAQAGTYKPVGKLQQTSSCRLRWRPT